MRRFVPRTQLFGATAAALRYNAASRAVATMAARWLRTASLGHSDDSSRLAKRECVEAALQASTQVKQISGFDLKTEISGSGPRLEFLGAAVTFRYEKDECSADLSLPPNRVKVTTPGDGVKAFARNISGADAQNGTGTELCAYSRHGRGGVSSFSPIL